MLLKVAVDEQFPLAGVRPQTAVWLVQDHLPLSHPQNIAALLQALKCPGAEFPADRLVLQGPHGVLDHTVPVKELQVTAGTTLTTAAAQSPRVVRRGTVHHSPGAMSPRGDDDDGTSTAADDEEGGVPERPDDEEYYVASECGWFPFALHNDGGEPVATVLDPSVEPKEDDPDPNTLPLCAPCAHTVAACGGLPVDVDRHYKPMLLDTDILSGWLEKLGGTRIQRWQRRWFIVSEKDVDWYESPPTVADKKKIRGTRAVVGPDGGFGIREVHTRLDPQQHPKCKDPLFHYFGLTFASDDRTIVYRSGNAAEVAKFVGFFTRLKKRHERNQMARDPVFWKRSVDGLLVRASDVGEYCQSLQDERGHCERETVALRGDNAGLSKQRPGLEAAVEEQRSRIVALQAELRALEDEEAAAVGKATAAKAHVEEERATLSQLEHECAETMRHHGFVQQRALEQRAAAEAELTALGAELDGVAEATRVAFAAWRREEERHQERQRCKGDGGSTLSFSLGRTAP